MVFLSPKVQGGLLARSTYSILSLLEMQILGPRLVSTKSDCILLKSPGNIYVHLSLRDSDIGYYRASCFFLDKKVVYD